MASRGYAHRAAFEAAFGKLPKGQPLDHTCNRPACINPEHLEKVTPRENVHRAQLSRVTGKTTRQRRVDGGREIRFTTSSLTIRCPHCNEVSRVSFALVEGQRESKEKGWKGA